MEAVKHQNMDRHGFDFLMSWEQAVAAAANIGPNATNELQDLLAQACNNGIGSDAFNTCSNPNLYVAHANVPDVMGNPPNHHGVSDVNSVIQCFESFYGNRTIEIDGTSPITNASLVFEGYTGTPTGDNYAWYTFSWTSASTDVMIKMAARAAVGFGPCGYGQCWGAGHINGAPYHFILETLDGDAMGRRDNQTMVQTLECNLNMPIVFGTPTATDNCSSNPQIVMTVNDDVTYPTTGSVRHCRSWSATDDCQNTSTCTQCITIECPTLADNSGNAERYANMTNVNGISVSAYPNPFKSTVTIEFSSDINAHSTVEIYTVAGEKVATLFNEDTQAGVTYRQDFDAKGLAEGIYIYRIINGDNVMNGKLTLMK
jgi:hypothetical protein